MLGRVDRCQELRAAKRNDVRSVAAPRFVYKLELYIFAVPLLQTLSSIRVNRLVLIPRSSLNHILCLCANFKAEIMQSP